MPPHLARGNASRARVRVAIEHVFAAQKCRRGLIVCAVGLARATARLGLANLVTNMPRLAWFATRAAPASAAGGPKAGLAQSPAHRSSTDHRRGSTLTEILHSRSPHNPVLRGVRLSRRHLAPNPYRQGDPPDSRERRHRSTSRLRLVACGATSARRTVLTKRSSQAFERPIPPNGPRHPREIPAADREAILAGFPGCGMRRAADRIAGARRLTATSSRELLRTADPNGRREWTNCTRGLSRSQKTAPRSPQATRDPRRVDQGSWLPLGARRSAPR